MALWRFLDYCTDDHPPRNLIQIWYGEQDLDVQAAFDATVTLLAATEDWRKAKEFGELKREHVGLGELRFAVDMKRRGKRTIRRFRPVGIWCEERREFIFLMGCEKAKGVYAPADAFDLALRHKARFEAGKGSTREHY
jgi:hypothetical protein